MKPPEKEPPRSRRSKTFPPPTSEVESTLPPREELQVEVPRFYERTAPLAALSTQVRLSESAKDKATAAGRLARQLGRRHIEVRDALALAEKSLTIVSDAELALDVARWWSSIGELGRSIAVMQAVMGSLTVAQKHKVLLDLSWAHMRLGKSDAAAQALRQLLELSPADVGALELWAALGFWGDLPKDECARAYLRAADSLKSQDSAQAFELRLRAFEVDPTCGEAAYALATTLRQQGRPGAAAEIIRELLRSASAAQRAAHHQRAFQAALALGQLAVAFESALEAELDIDVDPGRLHALLLQGSKPGADFETLIVRLVEQGSWGQTHMLASWLLALAEVSRNGANDAEVQELSAHLVEKHGAEPLPWLDTEDNDDKIRVLKTRLAIDRNVDSVAQLRFELARRLCRTEAWEEAALVMGPLLEATEVSLAVATFGAALGGRTTNLLGRVRSLVSLAANLPNPAGAVTYAVAAEHLLNAGLVQEARHAADAAVEAEPTSERAIATQALVALRAPDGASATLLEHALSVLVPRSDACALLAESASQRGTTRLALSWAGRASKLRPGDVQVARRYLQQACAQRDPATIAETLGEVMEQPLPLLYLQSDIGDCLTLMSGASQEQVEKLGHRIVARLAGHPTRIFQKLAELSDGVGASQLSALLIEVQLISVAASERPELYRALAEARLATRDYVAAARALRRGQLLSLPSGVVANVLAKFPSKQQGEHHEPELEEGDALLPFLELRADLDDDVSVSERQRRLLMAGCARWDLAQDRQAALELWLRAARLEDESGFDLLGHYLRLMAGSEAAAQMLKDAAHNTLEPTRAGRLLGLAAREMLRLGKKREAFQLGSAALEKSPSLADLLTIVEAACDEHSLSDLEHLYDLLASRCMGNFGERAVHYRAARQLEKRGSPEAALRHACAAFEAEPAEGVAYVMMARLAEATAGHATLLASLGRVADRATSDVERGRWIGLAAALSDTEGVGRRERLEILFRAAQMMPQADTLDNLFDGLAHCLADEPDSKDELWARFVKLGRETMTNCAGEAGANICLAFAVTSLSHFEQPDFALRCLNSAIQCDTTADAYERLLPYVTQLSGRVPEATEMVEAVRATEQTKGVLLGRNLARLVGQVAELLGDRELHSELLVRSAADFPEDGGLVADARRLAYASGRPDLVARVEELLPSRERARLVLERLGSMSDAHALDALVELDVDVLESRDKIRVLLETGARQEGIGRWDDAVETYRLLLESDPNNEAALRGIERYAEAHGNNEELLQILQRRIELSKDSGEVRRLTLRRAAVLETKLGRAPEARRLLQDFLGRGEDRAALRLLSDSWERTGDFTEAGELWERVHAVALDSIEADDAAYRAAVCFAQAGTPERARAALGQIKSPSLLHLELALEVARSIGDKGQICTAICALCDRMMGDNARQGTLLMEAAELALSENQIDDARRIADRALLVASDSTPVKLLVARLRAMAGALTTSAHAAEMHALLSGTETLDNPDDQEMACFLRAKSEMLSGDRQKARQLLQDAIQERGERPLWAALLAELLDPAEAARALVLTEVAMGGNCHGFYTAGELRVRAAEVAQQLGDRARARGYLAAVSDSDPARARAIFALERLDEELPQPQASATEQQPEEHVDLDAIRNAAREEHRRAAQAALAREELAGPVESRRSRPTLRAMIAANPAAVDVEVTSLEPASLTQESHRSPEAPLNPAAERLFSPDGEIKVSTEPSAAVPQTAVEFSAEDADERLLERLDAGDRGAGLTLLDRLAKDKVALATQ